MTMTSRNSREVEALLDQARKDPTVLAVMLFGSVARGEARPDSDVDICLVLEPTPPPEGRREPSVLTEKRLQYLHFDLDVKLFEQLPLYVRHQVLKEGRVLFVRDEDRLYGVALRAVKEFEDFKPRYREYLEAVSRAET